MYSPLLGIADIPALVLNGDTLVAAAIDASERYGADAVPNEPNASGDYHNNPPGCAADLTAIPLDARPPAPRPTPADNMPVSMGSQSCDLPILATARLPRVEASIGDALAIILTS